MKKILAILLTALMLFSVCSVAFASDEGIASFAVNPYGKAADSADTVNWYKSGNNYFMFLPAGVNLTTAVVYFTAGGEVTLDGQTLSNGGSAAALTEGVHTLACGGTGYSLTVCKSADIPAVYITTESGSLDYLHANKENKEPGAILIYDGETVLLNSALKQIKGRGNSTWNYPKKPYNIKFDKKTALFGMPKAKKWTLLANYFDYSLLHTPSAVHFAEAFGLPYTSEYKHADLYINGNYMGNYYFCESVEIGENRVEINDLEKANENANPGVEIEECPIMGTGAGGAVQKGSVKGSRKWADIPNVPENITGGYLMEYEYSGRYNAEPCGFVTKNGQPIVLKSPEYAAEAEVNYIADFMDDATEALYAENGYNAKGKHYSEYFDMDSLINMYILQEMAMNYDAALSSYYAFKPEDCDKVYLGPVWDMDNAFGSRSGKYSTTLTDTSVWWSNLMGYHNMPTMLTAAYSHESFREQVSQRWAELRQTDIFSTGRTKITALKNTLEKSATMNALRWNHFSTASVSTANEKWRENAQVCIDFSVNRASALDRGFGQNRAYLYYDKNGAYSGDWGFVTKITEKGDTVTVKGIDGNGSISAPSDRPYFIGWNTKADGTGATYKPGDRLTLTEERAVLYAMWSDTESADDPGNTDPGTDDPGNTDPGNSDNGDSGKTSFWDKIVAFFKKVIKAIKDFFLL